MKTKVAVGGLVLALGLLPLRSAWQAPSETAIRPARVEVMRNIELNTSKSGLPVSLPKEWGSLVTVQKLDDTGYVLFLENAHGEIYLVRLIRQGDYLYLDTYDRGGVALVIPRNP